MAPPPSHLLQQQLDTALQLILSFSSMMTTDEILMVKVRLAEADILLTRVLVERGSANTGEHPEHRVAPPVTPRNNNAAGGDSGDHGSVDQASTHHSTAGYPTTSNNSTGQNSVNRPVTRSAAHRDSAVRSLASLQRARNVRAPIIEIESDDE